MKFIIGTIAFISIFCSFALADCQLKAESTTANDAVKYGFNGIASVSNSVIKVYPNDFYIEFQNDKHKFAGYSVHTDGNEANCAILSVKVQFN